MQSLAQELIAEIKDNIKNKELTIAQYNLEELKLSHKLSLEEEKEVSKLEKIFFSEDKKSNLQQACWKDRFFIDYFAEWTKDVIEDKRFHLIEEEKEILNVFFGSESLNNSHKCYVIENLYLLKIDYIAPFANKELKQVLFLSALKLNELEIFQQRKELKLLLEQKIEKNPSLLNFAIIILNQIYYYCFPHSINFDLELLATVINEYLINHFDGQEPSLVTKDNKFKQVLDFVTYILQNF